MKKGGMRQQVIDDDDPSMVARERDRMAMISEFVMAPLFQRVLYDRAPAISLVNKDGEILNDKLKPQENNTELFIRSKFLDSSFETLAAFSESDSNNEYEITNINQKKLSKIEGFEKVIAACFFCSDTDYHGGNVGVVQKDDIPIAVKIDHGLAGLQTYSSEQAMRADLSRRFLRHGYMDMDSNPVISFDLFKFRDSLIEMLNVSTDEIEQMVSNRFHTLSETGMDFKDNIFLFQKDNEFKEFKVEGQTSKEQLEKIREFYVTNAIARKENLQNMVATLDIFAKIDFPPKANMGGTQEWINKNWLTCSYCANRGHIIWGNGDYIFYYGTGYGWNNDRCWNSGFCA